jgi:hypothetical protein
MAIGSAEEMLPKDATTKIPLIELDGIYHIKAKQLNFSNLITSLEEYLTGNNIQFKMTIP